MASILIMLETPESYDATLETCRLRPAAYNYERESERVGSADTFSSESDKCQGMLPGRLIPCDSIKGKYCAGLEFCRGSRIAPIKSRAFLHLFIVRLFPSDSTCLKF